MITPNLDWKLNHLSLEPMCLNPSACDVALLIWTNDSPQADITHQGWSFSAQAVCWWQIKMPYYLVVSGCCISPTAEQPRFLQEWP